MYNCNNFNQTEFKMYERLYKISKYLKILISELKRGYMTSNTWPLTIRYYFGSHWALIPIESIKVIFLILLQSKAKKKYLLICFIYPSQDEGALLNQINVNW